MLLPHLPPHPRTVPKTLSPILRSAGALRLDVNTEQDLVGYYLECNRMSGHLLCPKIRGFIEGDPVKMIEAQMIGRACFCPPLVMLHAHLLKAGGLVRAIAQP